MPSSATASTADLEANTFETGEGSMVVKDFFYGSLILSFHLDFGFLFAFERERERDELGKAIWST